MTSFRRIVQACLPLLVFSIAGCGDLVVDGHTLEIGAVGEIEGFAFLDLDGDGQLGGGDEPYTGLRLQLLSAGSGRPVETVTTDATGNFVIPAVPVGTFRLVADAATEPDSVDLFGLRENAFDLYADSTESIEIRASFPFYRLEEVRLLPPGIRVITSGIALNSRASNGDGVVHLKEGNVYLRATGVDRVNLAAGDSVRFIGRTGRAAGQPILDDVRSFRLVQQAVFVQPVDLTTALASTAFEGSLDAGLVRIQNAVIEDTLTVGTSLVVTADDGSGPVDLVLRDFLGFNTAPLNPDSTVFTEAVGLLVPYQAGPETVRWRMTPRGGGDLDVDEIVFPGLAPEGS